jgi:SPP1 gp7 family putative phage head morphogenesis protein
MTEGVRSPALSDALIARQHDVERFKTGLHDEYDGVSDVVAAALIVALGKLNTRTFGTITKRELQQVVTAVLKKYDAASLRYTSRITNWLERYTNDEARFMGNSMNKATDNSLPIPAVWPFVAATIIGATGLGIGDTLKGLRTSQRNTIKKFIQRAYVQRWTTQQVIQGFKGTVARKLKDGLVAKLKRAAAATVDTVVQFGMSASRIKVMQKYMDWTLGYTWVSILDGRTSKICRSLSGRVYKYGAGPVPPMHYRCRSHIEPIFKKSALRDTASGVVSAGETYYEWLARQSASFQDDVLGSSWAKVFRKGGLSADEFAAKVLNRRYQPLTLDELKAKYPSLF